MSPDVRDMIDAFGHTNEHARELGPMNLETRIALDDFYTPHNKALATLMSYHKYSYKPEDESKTTATTAPTTAKSEINQWQDAMDNTVHKHPTLNKHHSTTHYRGKEELGVKHKDGGRRISGIQYKKYGK